MEKLIYQGVVDNKMKGSSVTKLVNAHTLLNTCLHLIVYIKVRSSESIKLAQKRLQLIISSHSLGYNRNYKALKQIHESPSFKCLAYLISNALNIWLTALLVKNKKKLQKTSEVTIFSIVA